MESFLTFLLRHILAADNGYVTDLEPTELPSIHSVDVTSSEKPTTLPVRPNRWTLLDN